MSSRWPALPLALISAGACGVCLGFNRLIVGPLPVIPSKTKKKKKNKQMQNAPQALTGPRLALDTQIPYPSLILSGAKTVETREYPMPADLEGQEVAILETPNKEQRAPPRLLGVAVFGKSFRYGSQEQWQSDSSRHGVSLHDPNFGWDPSKPKYGWPVKEVHPAENPVVLRTDIATLQAVGKGESSGLIACDIDDASTSSSTRISSTNNISSRSINFIDITRQDQDPFPAAAKSASPPRHYLRVTRLHRSVLALDWLTDTY